MTVERVQRAGVHGFVEKNGEVLDGLEGAIASVLEGRAYYSQRYLAVRERMRTADSRYRLLTPGQQEYLRLFSELKTDEEIARILGRSPRSVAGRRTIIKQKLGVSSFLELLRYANDQGFGA